MNKDKLVPAIFTLAGVLFAVWLIFFVILPIFIKVVAGLLFYGAMALLVIGGVTFVIKMLVD